jgi:hypothetical protein
MYSMTLSQLLVSSREQWIRKDAECRFVTVVDYTPLLHSAIHYPMLNITETMNNMTMYNLTVTACNDPEKYSNF